MATLDNSQEKFPRKFGNYHLLGPLAQGGMGVLYLAVTGARGLERLLVIKTVLPHLADSEYIARFRDEAKVVVQLTHGNLIPVFDAGQVDGELFLAMEFVEGKDLRAVWNRCAKKQIAFPVDVAVYLTKELCRGLGYAHSFGDLQLVHRDVSPPNVLISYTGEVKLTDFGLASSTLKLEKTAPGIIYGKVAYMSPEQARGDTLDGRSDLYAAGIILWELLTGRQLYPPGKEQPADLLKRAKNPFVDPPSHRAPRVPKTLDAICRKALAPDRDERYATGGDFRDALSGWLADESPAMDESKVEAFLQKLFADDMVRGRAERKAMMAKTRERIRTLPPSHELRKMLEEVTVESERRREEGPNLGRRGVDDGAVGDRRNPSFGRRNADWTSEKPSRGRHVKTERGLGIIVDVPKPGAGVVKRPESQNGAALARAPSLDTLDEPHPSESAKFIGLIIDGRYQIEKLIGEGGMGRVYLAEHVEIGKRVAVKILHPVYSRMPDLVERFRREARAASKIGHPHIVDVTDSGTTDDGSVYFVMEYLEGFELAGVIDRQGALDVPRALRIATQICRALAAAHAVGIIHRDLKPENVFLTHREGTSDFVKVLDFGIAKSTEAEQARSERLTHPGMAMGTPEYMAPEQAAGKPADARTDIYAVGAIIYEMITGNPPYEGDNFMEILSKKATVDPQPARELRPEIPEAVERVVIQSMAREPDDRPPSMEALEYELTKCLSGRGAAVAKILGMPTDPALVASINPGLSFDDSSNPEARLQTAPPFRPAPHPAVTRPALIVPTPAPVAEASAADTEVSVPPSEPSRGRIRATGWVLLALALAAGSAAVLFVASGERRATPAPPTTVPGPTQTRPTPPPTKAVNPDDPKDTPSVRQDAVAVDAASEKGTATVARDRDRKKKPQDKLALGEPKSNDEAGELLKEAKKHVAKIEWAQAEEKYLLVANSKYRKSAGYVGLAEVAFEARKTDKAIRYAKKARKSKAAMRILGHAYFQKGQYAVALDYYERVLAKDPGNVEIQRSAKKAREAVGK